MFFPPQGKLNAIEYTNVDTCTHIHYMSREYLSTYLGLKTEWGLILFLKQFSPIYLPCILTYTLMITIFLLM